MDSTDKVLKHGIVEAKDGTIVVSRSNGVGLSVEDSDGNTANLVLSDDECSILIELLTSRLHR